MRDAWAGRIDLQAVSICPLERFAGDDGAALADEVARSGGILGMTTTGEGGQAESPEFQSLLDRFFALAEDRGLALDLHLDETGDPTSRTLDAVARTAITRGFKAPDPGRPCLLAVDADRSEAMATIALCAEAGLSVINLPMCNMYLQGRRPGRTPRWRGITLVHEFRAAGVPVSFASDNCRDPFYAYGDYDMMEVYREAVRIAQLDHPFGGWAASVTATAGRVLRLRRPGPHRRRRPGRPGAVPRPLHDRTARPPAIRPRHPARRQADRRDPARLPRTRHCSETTGCMMPSIIKAAACPVARQLAYQAAPISRSNQGLSRSQADCAPAPAAGFGVSARSATSAAASANCSVHATFSPLPRGWSWRIS